MPAADARQAINAIWRIEFPRLVAALARIVRDVGLAEDLAQEALVAALEQWPGSGVPENPAAWLMAAAKRRAIDLFRRNRRLERKHEDLARRLQAEQDAAADSQTQALDEEVSDDMLRLIFTACHPVLTAEARVALTLRLVGGLTTDEIARAFLVAEPAIAQRIVRAKRTLATKRVAIEVPAGTELADRLASVLEVIYLIFNEGYTATSGDHWTRPELCDDALRLARILAELIPREPEVHGLAALLEIQASRLRARVGPAGQPIRLLDQNRAQWDQLLIHRGLAALARGEELSVPHGPYLLQAAIAACHARAVVAADTNWQRIAQLYAELARVSPSPIVELNRAAAVAMADGPAAGLAIVEPLSTEPSLQNYHLLPAVRGDLLEKLGRLAEARLEFERAASLTRNARERELLLDRARQNEGQ